MHTVAVGEVARYWFRFPALGTLGLAAMTLPSGLFPLAMASVLTSAPLCAAVVLFPLYLHRSGLRRSRLLVAVGIHRARPKPQGGNSRRGERG